MPARHISRCGAPGGSPVMSIPFPSRRLSVPLVLTLVAGGLVAVASRAPASAVSVVRSSVSASDGSTHSVVNHLVVETPARSAAQKGGEVLVGLAGGRKPGGTQGRD